MNLFSTMLYGDFNELIEKLQESYNKVKSELDDCRKTISEWNSDVELKKAHGELEDIHRRSLAILSEREQKLNQEFKEKHYESCKNGSTYQYELCGAGIGTAIKIICPVCGEEQDITDNENW